MDKSAKLSELVRLGSQLNTIQDLDMLLEKILYEARRFVNADAGTIYVKNSDHLVFTHTQNDTLTKKLPSGEKLIYNIFKVPINLKSISGYVASTGEILNIPDVYNIPEKSPYTFDPTFDRISEYKTQSMLTIPLKSSRGDMLGVLQVINALDSDNRVTAFKKDDELYVEHFASTASIILQRAQMTRTLLLRMIAMAELRDPKETGAHVNRVASFSVELYERWARYKSIPEYEIDLTKDYLRMASMLHDVGKVGISDLILKKPARFTEEEYEIMKTHTYIGARLLKDKYSEFDEIAQTVALTHHENYDGTGYPGHIDIDTGKPLIKDSKGKAAGLKGEEIPIYGRIVALADVYDALMSIRVYKEAWSEKDTLKEIKDLSGKKFDPDIVDCFFESLNVLKSISSRYREKD